MSNSVQPHRRQPTRLPCPWDSPGKITGVGCHFLLQCMKVKSESEVTQSCLTLSDPMDCSPPGSVAANTLHSASPVLAHMKQSSQTPTARQPAHSSHIVTGSHVAKRKRNAQTKSDKMNWIHIEELTKLREINVTLFLIY